MYYLIYQCIVFTFRSIICTIIHILSCIKIFCVKVVLFTLHYFQTKLDNSKNPMLVIWIFVQCRLAYN